MRKRTSVEVMLPPATITVTEVIIITTPTQSRGVTTSSKIVTPNSNAVTGSKAPRIAVGVAPINFMAEVVHSNDTAVGNNATYTLTDVMPGTYQLKVSKANHVARVYSIIVE